MAPPKRELQLGSRGVRMGRATLVPAPCCRCACAGCCIQVYSLTLTQRDWVGEDVDLVHLQQSKWEARRWEDGPTFCFGCLSVVSSNRTLKLSTRSCAALGTVVVLKHFILPRGAGFCSSLTLKDRAYHLLLYQSTSTQYVPVLVRTRRPNSQPVRFPAVSLLKADRPS